MRGRICVFCGGNSGNDPAFLAAARALGSEIARRDLGLVYGGSTVGLMGAVADAALAAGGQVHGVIPASLAEREQAHPGLTVNERVASLAQRKERMFALADAFIALPGGFGTLDEFFEALTLSQIGEQGLKPCVLLSTAGFYDQLVAFLDHATTAGLLQPRYRAMVLVASTPSQAVDLAARG